MVNKLIKLTLLILAFQIVFGVPAQADEVEELKQKIEDRQKAIKEIEVEITKYNAELSKTSAQSKTLSGEVARLETLRKKLNADISLTENKITATQLKIESLKDEIKEKNTSIAKHRDAIKESLRKIRQNDSVTLVEALLSHQTWSEAILEASTYEQFENATKDKIVELENIKVDLSNKEIEASKAKKALENYKTEVADQRSIAETNKQSTNKLLSQTKNKESEYIKLLADRKAKKDAFERELFDFESQLKFVLDPSKIPPAGKGVLAWPLDQINLTQQFGVTSDSKRLYASGSHNGVDFRASEGTRVKSAGNGTVLGVGDTDKVCPGASYGKWILIKHPNGLATLYAHLSLIKVVANQTVATGEVIGYSGNTGYTTGPHLHLTVYAADAVQIIEKKSQVCGGTYTLPVAPTNAYLDPLIYL